MNTPLYDFLLKYSSSDILRCHMPGHKGKFRYLENICNIDITEIKGADSLFEADGIILQSEKNMSDLYGTATSFYSAGGSTLCIQAMLAAMKFENRKIIAVRNVHRAFLNAAALLDIDVIWLMPKYDSGILSGEINIDDAENLMKKYPFNGEFQKTLPVEQKLERLNTFLKKNGLAEIALLQSYYDYEEREKVLEQTMHQFEKKFSEIGVRESSKLSESQKGEVAAMTASFLGKKDGLKLLNSTPVSVLKYYFKEKIEQEQDFAVTTESVNSETIFNALEQNFQKLGDIPFSTAKQVEFFQKNGCNAAETYQAVKALKSQKSITDKISPTDILLPYPNNLLLELGITVSNQPVSAEFTSNLMQMIDETLKMQKTSLSELLEMRYEKNLPFEKIAKATKMPSVTASLPKKIQILKENKTFMQNAVEMYEAELNPEKVFSRKKEEIPSKPLPSKHTIAEQHFKSPVPKSDNPPVPEYPNNLLQAIGIDSEKPLSREFEKNLWEIIQKTNISDRNMDILMQYYHDGRTQAELTKTFLYQEKEYGR